MFKKFNFLPGCFLGWGFIKYMNDIATKYTVLAKKYARKFFARLGFHLIRARHSRWQYELYEDNKLPKIPKYVNLGAGSFYHPLWHNIDMPNKYYNCQQDHLHIIHDFSRDDKFPLKTDSVEIFYTSHVIEHLTDHNVMHLFNEIYRCLIPGGVLRITCPDMELQYNAYRTGDVHFWDNLSPWGSSYNDIEQKFLEHFATILTFDRENYTSQKISSEEFRRLYDDCDMKAMFDKIISRIPSDANSTFPEGHCNWFNYDKLKHMLENTGFRNIINSRYLQSGDPRLRDPRLFDGTCPELSVYVECKK